MVRFYMFALCLSLASYALGIGIERKSLERPALYVSGVLAGLPVLAILGYMMLQSVRFWAQALVSLGHWLSM